MSKLNRKTAAALAVAAVVVMGTIAALILTDSNSEPETDSNQPQTVVVENLPSPPADVKTPEQLTKEQLLFLIEEEKLAHDVYTVMYQKYGAKAFGNILESETSHQGRVLTLLQARGIADPRSAEIGVFNNAQLQAFYDKLIAQGNISLADAYRAGVAIEERDIADISVQLSTATDQDVIAALEVLRSGSESHLRAFNRQL